MSKPHSVDQQPGPMPAIRSEGDSIVFEFAEMGIKGGRLTIRCDQHGNVFASIAAPSR
jgi:hypothetical protein